MEKTHYLAGSQKKEKKKKENEILSVQKKTLTMLTLLGW
jgi:hypothetical protein